MEGYRKPKDSQGVLSVVRWCLNSMIEALGKDNVAVAFVDIGHRTVYRSGLAPVDLGGLSFSPEGYRTVTHRGGWAIIDGDPIVGHLVLWLGERQPGAHEAALVRIAAALIVASYRNRVAQERLRTAEEVAVVGDMTSRYAHEMKNILAVIGGSVDLLERAIAQSGDSALRIVSRLKSQAQELESLALSLLAMRRDHTTEEVMMCGDLGHLLLDLANLTEILGQGKDLEVVVRVEPVACTHSPRLVREALFNILKNATEASPDGGLVSIECQKAGEMVHISISDQGRGLPAYLKDRLFEPFFTTKGSRGTGLGLGVARHIIEEVHRGSIDIRSAEGEGTTVTVTLPGAVMIAGSD